MRKTQENRAQNYGNARRVIVALAPVPSRGR
jgi:hypothetical protein